MGKENKKKFRLPEGHRFPITRREFLAAGLIEGMTIMAAPTVVSLFGSRRAYAETLVDIPILELTAGGGASFNHQTPPFDKGGQALTDYSFAGREGALPNVLNEVFEMPFYTDGDMLRGIMDSLTNGTGTLTAEGQAVINLTRAAKVLCNNADDSSSNPFALSHYIQKLKTEILVGNFKAKGVGQGGQTGGRHASLTQMSQYVPLNMTNVSVAETLFTFGGTISSLSDSQKLDLANSVKNLSGTFNFDRMPNSLELKKLVGSSYSKVVDAVQNTDIQVDPRADALYQRVFGINNATAGNAVDVREATITKLVLDGISPVGTIARGGYDYHTKRMDELVIREFELGQRIGRLLLSMQGKGKGGMLVVSTDGSVSWGRLPNQTALLPMSDGGQFGIPFLIFAMGRTQAPTYTAGAGSATRHQRGYATSTGLSHGSMSPAKAFATVVATYLHSLGKLDRYPELFPERDPLEGDDLSQVAIFNPLV